MHPIQSRYVASPSDLSQLSPDDPRLDPGYYAYYYSQRPLDPRLPPPILLPWTRFTPYDQPDEDNQQREHPFRSFELLLAYTK